MVPSPWLTVALGAVGLVPGAVALFPPASTAPRAIDFCPERCAVSGPSTGNWSVYPDFKSIKRCQQTMFYDFSLYDPVDEQDTNHRIQACSSFGSDFDKMPSEAVSASLGESANHVDVEFELGWWDQGFGLAKPGIRSLVEQLREYIDHGHGSSDRPFILYGQSGPATIGVYIGQDLLNQGLSASALAAFQDNFDKLGDITTPSLAMQLCGPNYGSTHTFGVAVTSNGTFAPIQNAIQSWANGTCLSFLGSKTFPGTVPFTTPLLKGHSTNSTLTNTTVRARHNIMHSRSHAKVFDARAKSLEARAVCSRLQVKSGEGCPELAVRCGISPADFTKYNARDLCATLRPKQWVCCSMGTLPDLRPKPNADGSCSSHKVAKGENCADLGAEYGLTNDELEDLNKKTWGWSGCKLLFAETIMCLSTGTPPFPAPIANAVCGPQKPGSTAPKDGSNIADLHPCPLNACCNIWGQCGVTKDFCIDTNTGPPGTAKAGTYGCISNCGVDVIKGTGTGAIKLAYFQGYNMGRKCLYQDALQIDTSKHTHIHFGFGTLTPSYEVLVGDALSAYQFTQFKRIKNAKRILSFGGWAFSNDADTYKIFRTGVQPANRLKMATNIANFIKKHELDGVDIDWEYPGAPDLPNSSDPGKAEDGPNYLAFLAILKNLVGSGKTVAIAAPASYWYLKQFPIKEISKIVDYIVYMTYDLHGQWDAQNKHSQEGCDTGNCLRSQVNLTETRQSLAMITKAGVPGNKIVVGVTSYGRSFGMEQAGCWGPTCKFTGTRLESHATPGRCTGQGGYIADAEINEIINDKSRVVASFLDPVSNSDILVYDVNQWVGYMSEKTKTVRAALYAGLGMAGTTDWASDLQKDNDPPKPAKDWDSFKSLAARGVDPKEDQTNLGTWKTFDCTHKVIKTPFSYSPADRWAALDTDNAWREIIVKWFNTDQYNGAMTFSQSVQQTLKMGAEKSCHSVKSDHSCDEAMECPDSANDKDSGPAAQFIWNSLIKIHRMHHSYFDTLTAVVGHFATIADDMETTFAPIPEPKTNDWLNILIDFLTLGTLTAAAPFFNGMLKGMAAFANPKTYDNSKDIALNLISQSTTLAKDMLQDPKTSPWTPAKQDRFTHYMGEAIFGWKETAELALAKLFNGSSESITILGNTMKDGNLIEGYQEQTSPSNTTATDLERNVLRSFLGFSIPALWRHSKTYAFILDSGAPCANDGHGNTLTKYLDDSTANKTGACHNGKQYYLVHPEGDSKDCVCQGPTDHGCLEVCTGGKFSSPVGLDDLSKFGNLSLADLVIGSVRTWEGKGMNNHNEAPKPYNVKTSRSELADLDITTPGYIMLPVCSPDRAFQSWDTGKDNPTANYPCDIQPGRDWCGDSTIEDATSGASPLVSDCLQIIRNIEGNGGTDFTTGVGTSPEKSHREILKHGSCHFGVERTGGTGGAAMFKFGGQNVIDLINMAVERFGGGGKIGAAGTIPCDGTTAGTQVKVLWGIY